MTIHVSKAKLLFAQCMKARTKSMHKQVLDFTQFICDVIADLPTRWPDSVEGFRRQDDRAPEAVANDWGFEFAFEL
jgi:hypothetical protein